MSLEELVIPRARRGRKPKPVPETPAAPAGGVPEKPPIITRDKVAARLWDDLVPHLVESRVVGPMDVVMLVVLTTAYSTFVRVRGLLRKEKSLTVTSDAGATKAHPLIAVEMTARRDLATAADKLGLSPTARARIAFLARRADGVVPEEDMELEELLAS